MRIVITGATGFVGKVLVRELLKGGDEVVVLTRNVAKAAISLGSACQYYQWDNVDRHPPLEAFEKADAVINLMGESIAQKWTETVKDELVHSRINSTRMLVEALGQLKEKPKVLISTSAIGIYGDRGSEEISEDSPVANDFLGKLCQDWENEAHAAEKLGMRVAIIRTGIVLGERGGALQKMLLPFKMGVGGKVGSGNQYMSWIHIEDLAYMYIELAKNDSLKGIFNGTASYPATNMEFTRVLGKVLRRPTLFPVPTFALKMMFGEMSQILLDGQKVLPKKFQQMNFRFRHPTLEIALKETAH